MPFKSSGRGAYGPQGQKVIKGPLAPVWVTSGALSNGNVGQAYSVQLSATDDSGDAPTYTIDSGSLPSGLSLSSSGLISGTIGGSAGTFTFTVNATDVNGRATTIYIYSKCNRRKWSCNNKFFFKHNYYFSRTICVYICNIYYRWKDRA